VTVTTLPLLRSVVEGVVLALTTAAVSLAVNGLRSGGLPLVATAPYQTLVPCPEPGGPVEAVGPSDPVLRSVRSFLIDARSAEEYASAHVEGAVSVPYDWLDPLPDEVLDTLARRVAASRASRVIAYGDGGRPDSGEYLGRELTARGIRNVFYARGGAPALLGGGSP
jgi:hypothetical protein